MAGRLREGLPYGAHPRQRLDLFLPAGAPRGLVVFVHGGYWRAFDRGTWSHLAAGPLAHGWAVAMPGYVLAPEARIAAITAMIAEAMAAAAAEVGGADPARRAFGRRAPGGAAGLRRQPAAGRGGGAGRPGGLDQRAARPAAAAAATLNDECLRLDAAEAASESPALRLPREGRAVHAWVGDGERPEFVRQTTLIANIWTGLGAEMEQTIEPRRHHFNVIDGLTHPGSGLVEAIVGTPGMRTRARVVVIGGGVVGCSVLYHLAKAGWTDVMLIERSELTSGSSWHAAGGFHTLNGDPNVAKLQAYTVGLYRELEEVSGQSCGLHLTGGVMMAGTPERMDFLRLAHAKGRCLGHADRDHHARARRRRCSR